MKHNVTLEVCCGDIESAKVARKAGVTRIELCAALEVGGLTPSPGLVEQAAALGFPSLNVLVRPRRGDFVYTEDELNVIMRDIEYIKGVAGVTGIVFGALNANGSADIQTLRAVRRACPGHDFTFHRAFDFCASPIEELNMLAGEGCTTVLTSGQKPTAIEGSKLIRKLVEVADGRIGIMAGSGVNSSNVRNLVEETGVSLVHASARVSLDSFMRYRNNDLTLGDDDEWKISRSSIDEIQHLQANLRDYEQN